MGALILAVPLAPLHRRLSRHGARAAALLHLPPAHTAILTARFCAVTDALLLGILLTAAVQRAIVGVGFAVVGLRGPVLWGVGVGVGVFGVTGVLIGPLVLSYFSELLRLYEAGLHASPG